MNDTSNESTVLAERQRVAEFQEICQPRQRALLSLLAVCQEHSVDPAPFMHSFAQDLPRTPLESRRRTRKFFWSRIEDFSTRLRDSDNPNRVLANTPGLLPETVELAVHLEDSHGTSDEFNRAWLDRIQLVSEVPQSESQIGMLFPTFLKFGVILWITSFLMIWVVPEFIRMMEEFELEPPLLFDVSIQIADNFAKFWFIPAFSMLILLPWFLPAMMKYFKRWNPFTWQQPVLPESVKTKQALALVIHYRNLITSTALSPFYKLKAVLGFSPYFGPKTEEPIEVKEKLEFDWPELRRKKIISPPEAEALSIAESAETRAWLLHKSSLLQQFRIESRGMLITRFIAMGINVVLMVWVILMTFSLMATLITLLTEL